MTNPVNAGAPADEPAPSEQGTPSGDILDHMRGRGVAVPPALNGARRDVRGETGLLESLWRGGHANATDLAVIAAEFHGLPLARPAEVAAGATVSADLSLRFLRETFILPFVGEHGLCLAIADPGSGEEIDAVRLALPGADTLAILPFDAFERLFAEIGKNQTGNEGAGKDEQGGQAARADGADAALEGLDLALGDDPEALQDLARGAPIVRAVDQVLERALEAGATDIHFETGREALRIRLRVDGILRLDQSLPKRLAPAVISRIKILAGLDIAERRLPQDGRANIRIGHAEADLRIAVMPTLYGETAVARILLKDARLLDFARIGMDVVNRTAFERLLAEPHGIIIVTGPTGSGKTTTLATAVSLLNEPTRKIVTVEDPIEYQIAGIHQTQIKPSIGLGFAQALRAFLRHDPDVMMVGEMRDGETASIGIQAALTGHLVLTTLHTNSATDAVVRLADMGVEPYLIAASLRGVLGQRLVRRLCERCRRPAPERAAEVRDLCRARGLTAPEGTDFHRAVGCPTCGGSGFHGRVGVFEVFAATQEIRALIRERPDPQRLVAAARLDGMTTMLEDGLIKAAQGFTCIDEVFRAVG
ncbi:GspE/PulE family protein [Methylobacterium sp. Leaf93]|uniref:GspE/PulE family protein n=1 Tax=Methylobacterium sp. Leaf93 TaxID=1736249 RepID=UPI000ADA0E34|nr:GspE/PulE family protein [Methylobacterium sp. Leaf93]